MLYWNCVIPKVESNDELWPMQLGNRPRRKSVRYVCPNCDETLLESDNFCPRCGARILWQI